MDYTVFQAPYSNSLRTECDLELEDVKVIGTLHDEYSYSLADLKGMTEDGITLNVYAEPLDYFSEGVLYESIKYGGHKKSSAFFWILLCKVD